MRAVVIHGWDKGVATMSLGETAVLQKISADYGNEGAAGNVVIPPNTDLVFQVEFNCLPLGTKGRQDLPAAVVVVV